MWLDRLRRLTRHEVRWRAATALRSNAQRIACRIHEPRWVRADIVRVLAPDAVLEEVRSAAAASADGLPSTTARQWQRAHDALIARLRSRGSRFALNPASLSSIRSELLARKPAAAEEARARADRILGGEFDILGYRGVR